MAGELWQGVLQVGKENSGTPGTAVAGSRYMFCEKPSFVKTRSATPRHYATGKRDNVLNVSYGPVDVGGSLVSLMNPDEMTEFLLGTIQGGSIVPTVVSVSGQKWTFTPGSNLPDAQTWRWHDGARVWIAAGVRMQSMKIAGSVRGDNVVTCVPKGMSLTAGSLSSPTARTPGILTQGWETQIYIDALGATPGTTLTTAYGIAWDLTFANGLQDKFFADNTPNLGGISIGELVLNGKLTVEGANGQAVTEFDKWESNTARLVRLVFGNNQTIPGGSAKYTMSIDIPANYVDVNLASEDGGTRTYEMGFTYRYDQANGYGAQVILTNSRATAY